MKKVYALLDSYTEIVNSYKSNVNLQLTKTGPRMHPSAFDKDSHVGVTYTKQNLCNKYDENFLHLANRSDLQPKAEEVMNCYTFIQHFEDNNKILKMHDIKNEQIRVLLKT
jgi:hypothetical protein